MNLDIEINPLDYRVEKFVSSKISLKPPECYGELSEKQIDLIYEETMKKFPSELTNNFSKKIILSIRANLVRAHMVKKDYSLKSNLSRIFKDYSEHKDIIELSGKYDGSPLNILRLIFKKKYKDKITLLIKKPYLMDSWDSSQLLKAVDYDIYAVINQDEILKKSMEFENKIQTILNNYNIKYKTQEDLAKEQKKSKGRATITPDFLLKEKILINGVEIKWIDAKNYFGTNTNYLKKNIKKQMKKYIDKWGQGAIIFNLGFSSKLELPDILFIDYESFKK
jgi:hypothetical protein